MDIPLTLSALRAAYAQGVTPRQVIAQIHARLDAVDDPGIFLCLVPMAELLEAAEALGPYDPARPLWGVPFAIKDNIDAAGMVTTAGCPAFAYTAETDAFVVAQLRAAGALLIGKTNLDQFATGLVGLRTPYGAPRNALDPDLVPGGSSCGSAVAVAQGIVSFALGTDTAGSGRVPAALNGIVGLKPSLGSLSASGVVPACRSLDTVSVFALTVADAYAAFAAAARFDPADSYARRWPAPPLAAPRAPARIGVPDAASRRFFGDMVQAEAFEAALAVLAASGAQIQPIDFAPFYAVADMLYDGAWVAERYTVIEELLARDAAAIHPVTRQIITAAERLSAADAFRGMYRLKDLIRRAEPALAGIDMLCVPTVPTLYSLADLEADPITPNSNLGTYTNFVNLMDMCGIAVPAPARGDGRPGSVTLLAAAGQDAQIAAQATVLEAVPHKLGATPWPGEAAPLPGAEPEGLALAVCGAHMSGLPLNGELTRRGARLLGRAKSAPDYRFYALPGAGPARPGLVRGAPGSGGEIALEIWSLPLAEVGGFLAGIPAPLGLGTLRLNDGGSVQGFLCEAVAASGAEDITALGDWRRYLDRQAAPAK